MSIDNIIDGIIQVEGSTYTDHPADRGGPTKYGITQHTLSSVLGRPASAADVRTLTEEQARGIYRIRYVINPHFDKVGAIDERVGAELVDSGVNVGPGRAAEWLQRSLNALNRGGRDYPDMKVDGDIGPATLSALAAFIRVRGPNGRTVLFRMLNALQGAHYITLAERSPEQEAFVMGWFLNRVL